MKKIRLIAFTAAIISVAVPAFAQGIYLDLGGDGPRRYRDDGRRDRDYRGGLGCLNSFSASISGASAAVRLPSGVAAG